MRTITLLLAAAASWAPAGAQSPACPALPACGHADHGRGAPGTTAPDAIDARHEEMLARLAGSTRPGNVACCFSGPVPWATMQAFEAALAAQPQYQFALRWTATATNPGPMGMGEPCVLTYSFIPDGTSIPGGVGEPSAPSNMFAVLDFLQGRATWQSRVRAVFARWSSVCGITFVYEPNDDGAAFPASAGVLGTRGDLRIGGHYIDGQVGGNILAYAYYPHTGDIVFDTSNTGYLGDATSNALGFRNILAHEVGHTIGARHVCPYNSTKLMEAYITYAFDGPQHDEIRGAQRYYGDDDENNDTRLTATDLGLLEGGRGVANVGVDGAVDVDWYRFTVDRVVKVTITLTPQGTTYSEGPQTSGCTGVTTVNSLVGNNLGFELYDRDGTLLRRVDDQPAGTYERLSEFVLWSAPGSYWVRVFGAAVAEVQLYTLNVSSIDVPRVLSTLTGAAAGDEFGGALAGIGDVEGDGYDELLVGAPGNRDRGAVTGMARLFSGRTRSASITLYGASSGDEFGRAVAAAGDVDRDGSPDFAVGAPGDDTAGNDAGSVRLYSGRDGVLLRTMLGRAAGERFGAAVAGLGDVNLDGVPDLIVGAPRVNLARMLSAADGSTLLTLAQGSAAARFGSAVAAAGDVNRDGFPDLVVGAPDDDVNGTASGSAFVFSGFLASGALLYAVHGAAGENLGSAVDGVGDVDGDRYGEVVIGALTDQRSTSGSGYALLISGRTMRELHRFQGQRPADRFGFSVAGIGDADGDGFADLAIGAKGSGLGDPGYAKVFSGRGTALAELPGETPGGAFGVVAGAGDSNADAWNDVAIGAPLAGGGVVRVFSTSTVLRAGSKAIGTGCSAAAPPPRLTTDPPLLGRTAHVMLSGATPARAGSVVSSGVAAGPLPIGGGCRLYLDVSQIMALATFFTSSTGTGAASIRLPPERSLLGAQLALQAVVLPTTGPLGFDLTNGVIWTLAEER